MLECIDFLKERLNEFVTKFSFAKIKYEYNEDSLVHFIEVSPRYIYDTDEFLDWECDVYKKFLTFYPTENICFLHEDSVVKLDNPRLEMVGANYGLFYINDNNKNIDEDIKTTVKSSIRKFCTPITDIIEIVSNNFDYKIAGEDISLAA